MPAPSREFRWMSTSAGVLTAMSISSFLITFWEMTVPRTGEPPSPLLMLIPTRPGVAVSKRSARFPAIVLPMILFPLMSSAGSPNAGPTCVCSATPPSPSCVSVFPMITLSDTRPRPAPSGKHACPRTSNLHAVAGREVLRHRIVVHPMVRSERWRGLARWRMRSKHNAALQRVVLDSVVDEQVVMAFGGLVTDQDAIGIASDEVARNDRVGCPDQVKGAAAVPGFIGLINAITRLAGAAGKRPGENQARCRIVVDDAVVLDRDIRSAHHQNAFEQCVLYRKSRNRHLL